MLGNVISRMKIGIKIIIIVQLKKARSFLIYGNKLC